MDRVVKVDKVVKAGTGDLEDGEDMEAQEGTDMGGVEEDQEALEVMEDMDMGEVVVEVEVVEAEGVGVAFNSFTKSQNIFFTKISIFRILEHYFSSIDC